MKKTLILLTVALITTACNKTNAVTPMDTPNPIHTIEKAGYRHDTFTTPKGRTVDLIFIRHGSLSIDIDGYMIYVDPVTMFADYTNLPKADMILVTHEHHDHLDPKAIDQLTKPGTGILASATVAKTLPTAKALSPGQNIHLDGAHTTITTVPAYNTTPGHEKFHPKDRGDIGFILDIDGFRIYIAGDTEDIPEMAQLDTPRIDIAFLPVNQPYTMTPEQAIRATHTIKPRILYPYHYGETDLTPLVETFIPENTTTTPADNHTQIRIRDMQ